MNSNSQNRLIRMLADSQIYKDYERAFGETTGLPLNLSPVEHWQLAHHGRRHENPFCAIMAQSNKACAACLRAQQQTCDPAACEPRSVMLRGTLRNERAAPRRRESHRFSQDR